MNESDKVERLLDDLAVITQQAAWVTAAGHQAYLSDDAQGSILRNAGERVLIKVGTVVERLPEAFKQARPGIAWRDIGRMRNLVAHHYDHVNDDLVWNALKTLIPNLWAEIRGH